MYNIYDEKTVTDKAKLLFKEERSKKRLDGWFIAKECASQKELDYQEKTEEMKSALLLRDMIRAIPLEISEHAIFAGTQRDSFARSYALINPSFKVEEFSGYCDSTAVFDDIEINDEFTKERIEAVRDYNKKSDYVKDLSAVYESAEADTKEVIYFIEQVTGHLIPDFRPLLKHGITGVLGDIKKRLEDDLTPDKKDNLEAMKISIESLQILINRYKELALCQIKNVNTKRKSELELIVSTLEKLSTQGATNLYEAIQLFILAWQVMCLEQTPNPFAFSVGNADRIFEPYRKNENLSRENTASLLKHFLVFFNVGDRSWAISQNLIIGGKNVAGKDLTNETSYALLDAYFDMNLPQPILSVKLHKNTPEKLYEELGKFFFSPGILTPSLFNDDSMFEVLKKQGIASEDLENYSVAGCQEPLIMGKDNGNTTNSWLNLPKILELTLTGGKSLVTGEKLCDLEKSDLKNIRENFYKNLDIFLERMVDHANGASKALSRLRVPFLSTFMGGIESAVDVRDSKEQGTKYNGSGCLVHGLSVLADSFMAIDHLIKERTDLAERLVDCLENNFEGHSESKELRELLLSYPKFGNNISEVDDEAVEIVNRVSEKIRACKNYLGNPFRPDFSTPSTHLLYGYWVGATADGRKRREMLNYGVDPLYGESSGGMGFRMLSNLKLPFEQMNGGYASHFGIDPKYFRKESFEGKGLEFSQKIINPLFFNEQNEKTAPFYLYVNVTTPETLRKVLAEPKKYAPSGVYIMRIHGTFVNFLDLSPAIQQDIICRLDLQSTAL